MPNIRVAIADDQKLFSQTLALLLSTVDDFELVFIADNGKDFLEKTATTLALPQVALVDIDMPEMNGIELNRLLHANYPEIKVIMLSVHLELELINQAIDDGAASYLAKNCDKDDLIKAIRAVHQDGFYINQLTLQALKRASQTKNKTEKSPTTLPAGLTSREKDVLLLICEEKSSAEIAEQLYISVRTVEGHRNNLLAKTGCRNSAGLVRFALKHQLLELY